MKLLFKKQKRIASVMLLVMLLDIFCPTLCYALTSGPSQPEMQGFEPIGNSDMVDLSSGDFSYNIPLMDVGGYPVNLVYHSGAGMDDESGWVGYGWTLSPGVLNRQMRGLPDDFNGTDKLTKTVHLKDHITKGAQVSATLEALGIPTPKIKLKKKTLALSSSISLGVTFDNYRGVGASFGLNSGLKITEMTTTTLTRTDDNNNVSQVLDTSISQTPTGTSFNLSLSSFDGAGVSAKQNFNILQKKLDNGDKESISQSVGIGYNSRRGLSHLTLSASYNTMRWDKVNKVKTPSERNKLWSSDINFAGETYTPTIENPTTFTSFTFSLNLGPQVQIAFAGLGGTGFYNKQKVNSTPRELPVFGYMNAHNALQDEDNAVMDFNREKDIPYTNSVAYLPVPVPTYDLFVASSQEGSAQFRAYKGSSGVLFDNRTENKAIDGSLGIELGFLNYFDLGADIYVQDSKTTSKKWKNRNNFLAAGDYQQSSGTSPLFEPTYFKRVGELVPSDKEYLQRLLTTEPVAVSLSKNVTEPVLGAEATNKLRTLSNTGGQSVVSPIKRSKREVRNTTFSYLTAAEASLHGLDKTIKDYHPDSIGVTGCSGGFLQTNISRTSNYRKRHHISEVTITGDDGKKTIYGIPVYNTYQEDVSFSVDQNLSLRNKGLTSFSGTDNSTANSKGRENYYSKEITAPYATSFLLTGIVSPDYVDLKGDGISDDDLGTAVKFNYSKLGSLFKWRTPFAYGADSANYNEGLLNDERDDKANYVYGEKEIWYMHSIESKTMVAHFITDEREDGLGVLNQAGSKNTSLRLRKLKEIRLYSKSDLRLNGGNASITVPVKVVHFEYDYSICKGLPNSVSGEGKLVLKKIYFTFGRNNKGRLNPYTFGYDTSNYNNYDYRQYDRWGNFKDAAGNPGGLNNSEYPYTIQDSVLAAKFAANGQLNRIGLPSGGTIHITYESDDYAYVQDKRASIMCQVNGVSSPGDPTGLINSNRIYVDLPYPVSTLADMKYRYFQDIENLYFKAFLDLDAKGHKEFVPGYAKISSLARINDTTAEVTLSKVNGVNPIARAGWQFLRLNLPKYAYPGSENYGDNGSDLVKAIRALVTAFGTITELYRGFEKKAKNKGFSNSLSLGKSWVRLCAPTLKKYGGGSRVKQIQISDDWETMSGATGASTATITQLYSYTSSDQYKNGISSGVASYEPMLGNDENPFRQPITYGQNAILGLDDVFYIERPMGESFFPSASVVYSKVTVKSVGAGDDASVNRTGVSVSEFYTAKDYPTIVKELTLEKRKPASERIFKLIGGISMEHIGLSQGYSVETNDMHGRPKSVNIFNKSGQNISSVEYYYKNTNDLAARKTLDNNVKIIDSTGTVSDGLIGVDAEVYTDMRQHTTDNIGVNTKFSGGLGAIFIFPLPFFFPGISANYDRRSYRSSSTIKIVNRFAIQNKVVKRENGSSITTENVLWDAETGNVLLTKSQNEFDDPVYSFAYPAHWVYKGMGQAYQNLGTMLSGFSSASNGTISNSTYNSLLVPGDELIDVNSSSKYWVINSPLISTYQNRIIDSSGAIQQISGRTLKLVRSGRRNMANAGIATIVSLKNPIAGDKLNVSELTKVLDAKATIFREEWSMPVASIPVVNTNCEVNPDCFLQFLLGGMVNREGVKPFFFNTASDDLLTANTIIDSAYSGVDSLCTDFIGGRPAWEFEFYQYAVSGGLGAYSISSGDSAKLGSCKMYFDSVKPRFNTLANAISNVTDFTNCSISPCGSSLSLVSRPGVPCGYALVEQPCSWFCLPIKDSILKFRLDCSQNSCASPVNTVINPYYQGLLGNWRPVSQLAYHIKRENPVTDPAKSGSTDIRRSGAYSVFNPFWKRNTWWDKNPTGDIRWIAANEVTYFNGKGTELENKDALNRYSAAVFGYLESLPVAVASNARFREIAYDGFEDYGFKIDCSAQDLCSNGGHFGWRSLLNGTSADTTRIYAHSGKYSLKLTDDITLTKTVFDGRMDTITVFDGSGRYHLKSNELSKGFSPIPGKKYVLSFWVKDGSPRNPATTVQATVNGTNLINNLTAWPIVEGWKHVTVQFTISGAATGFTLKLDPGSLAYFDDIRIHPFDGHMKSFAYDASTQRLMAELDENNFASYYEYDDEGILIRVKKETERGVMTIKETRSSYRKQ